MKCFYCSNLLLTKHVAKCDGCGKELAKICPTCEIQYEKVAKFCTSCGEKLEDLPVKAAEVKSENSEGAKEEKSLSGSGAEEADILFDASAFEERDKEGEVLEFDVDFKPEEAEKDETEPEKSRIIIKISSEGPDSNLNGPDDETTNLQFEEEAPETEPNQPEKVDKTGKRKPSSKRKARNAPKDEKSGVQIATETESAENSKKSSEFEINFDDLFSELIAIDNEKLPEYPEEARRRPKNRYSKLLAKNGGFGDILSEDFQNQGDFFVPQLQNGTENLFSRLESDKILLKTASQYKLTPFPVNETYDVSFDDLIEKTITPEFADCCAPMLKKIEQNMRVCKGGVFFLRGQSGSGKSHFVYNLKKYAESTEVDSGCSVVVAEANIFDFDFMIFISLIRILMKIESNEISTVRKRLDTLFGDALPKSKKDCLSALICLNFAPVKTKLPKYDIEYLLSYVLYCLSRTRPVLWLINNAGALNTRTIKFFSDLKGLFNYSPIALVCVVDSEANVLDGAPPENIYDFKGFREEGLTNAISAALNTKRIPAKLETLLREKAAGNMLFAIQLAEYFKDLGFIFNMKGSWRFLNLPDDFVCPDNLDDLISKRVDLLPEDIAKTLREFTLLNLYSVPRSFFAIVSTTNSECVDELIKKGYLSEDGSSISFSSRSILKALKKKIKIGKNERAFYNEIVVKLASTQAEIYQLNKHWLLLSYINLGGIVDRNLNPFLFSSAVYMEKLGFFEISQRSYQTILSSFSSEDVVDDFRILLEIKNARLWKLINPQWAKIFWEKLLKYSKSRADYHLELLSKSEILLLETEKLDLKAIAGIVKKFHLAGCYEDEIRLIDKTTDLLIEASNYLDANAFAARAYKLLRRIVVKYDGKGIRPAEFIYTLYIRCACKLADIRIMLEDFKQASIILEEALAYAEKYDAPYFKSKILLLIGKIKFMKKEDCEEQIKEGFYNAIIGMNFTIIKAFLCFFEENGFENKEWVEPFLEYKNWINF